MRPSLSTREDDGLPRVSGYSRSCWSATPPLFMNALKLAIIGGGPSAFYVASRILKLLPSVEHPNIRVHLFDRLWAPHGLVRYGVAPDHPEVKASSLGLNIWARHCHCCGSLFFFFTVLISCLFTDKFPRIVHINSTQPLKITAFDSLET